MNHVRSSRVSVLHAAAVGAACWLAWDAAPVWAEPPGDGAGSGVAREQAISVDPLALVFGKLAGQYERARGAADAWVLGAGASHAAVADYTFTTAGVRCAWRRYPGGTALHGWYLSPVATLDVDWARLAEPAGGAAVDAAGVVCGLVGEAGWQWVGRSGFLMDAAAGAGWGLDLGFLRAGRTTVTLPDAGFGVTLRLALGWAWP